MNGRVAKKIRRSVEVDIHKTYVGLISSMMSLPLRKRLKFAFCLIFRRAYS
jgi:hypothetical protein